jgi:hypothetical protein
MKRTSVILLGLSMLALSACTSGSGGATPSHRAALSSRPSVEGSAVAADPLDGDWHQTFTCEENVRTFQRNVSELTLQQRQDLADLKGNIDASVPTLLQEFTREFAWGPGAKGPIHGRLSASQIAPSVICNGAPERSRLMRFLEGSLVVQDWDGGTWGTASYEFVGHHTFSVDDGGVNFGGPPPTPLDTFSFRIEGDRLTLTMTGTVDAWAGTFLEEAPWTRVT